MIDKFIITHNTDEKTWENFILYLNRMDDRIKVIERAMAKSPGDYAVDTLVGVKSEEGKLVSYTVAEAKTLLGI